MGTFTWIILIVVLQGVIASLAKKAQEKQGGAASTKGRAGGSPQPTSSTPEAAAPRTAQEDPIEIARRQIDEQIRARSSQEAARAQGAAPTSGQTVVVRRVEPAKPRPQIGAKPVAKTPKTPKVLARGGAKPPSVTAKPVQPRPVAAPARAEREESAAMSSRQRVADSVAAVRRAETKVDRAMPGEAMRRPEVDLKRPVLINARTFTATLRDPIRVREAFLLGEVLGPPRSARPF